MDRIATPLSTSGVLLIAVLLVGRPASGQTPTHTLVSGNDQQAGLFGWAVAEVGDTTGDGLVELMVGAPYEGPGAMPTLAGRAYVYDGASGALLHTLQSPNPQPNGLFGYSLAGPGDLSGDGVPDFLVGAYYEAPVGSSLRPGQVHVFSGADGQWLRAISSPNAVGNGLFGYALAGLGDLDGDGIADVLIGAPGEPAASGGAGRAYVLSGATGLPLHTVEAPGSGPARFGHAVAGVPDLDGDGHGDALIGAPDEPAGGRAYVVSGADGAVHRVLEAPTPQPGGDFGWAVTALSDVDGDGMPDLAIGAPNETPAGSAPFAGQVHVFSGNDGTWRRAVIAPDSAQSELFGWALAGGDLAADGRMDLIVGMPHEEIDSGFYNLGRVFVFDAESSTLVRTLMAPEVEDHTFFGQSVALTVGGALLVGAPGTGHSYFFAPATTTADEPEAPPVRAFVVHAVRPNPARHTATLTYELAEAAPVRLAVFDVRGREVAVLVDGVQGAGRHEVAFEAGALPGGVYLVRLDGGDVPAVRRLTILP